MKRHHFCITAMFIALITLGNTVATTAVADEARNPLISTHDPLWQQAADIRDAAIAGGMTIDTVASLVSEVGPRMTGTPSDRMAVDWALRKMRALGLQNVRTESVAVPLWEVGETRVRITGEYAQEFVATALGGSVGTFDDGIEAPVLLVRDIPHLNSIDPEQVRGKIVFINQRMARTKNLDGYRKAVVIRRDGAVAAARSGALAVIIRSVGTSSDRIAHGGATRYDEEVTTIPAAAISNPDADTLSRLLSGNTPVSVHLTMSARSLGRGESANVIGELPATGPLADDVVLLVAHLDTWANTPGAQDNAAGVAVMLEIARMLGAKGIGERQRTVRVLLVANEEFGFHGIEAYIERHQASLGNHVLAIEADGGAGRVWAMQSGVQENALPEIKQIQSLLTELNVEYLDNQGLGGPDVRRLGALGVPTMDLHQDMRGYFDIHHTENDTLAKIDPKQLRQMLAAFAVVTYVGAYSSIDFGRHPQLEASD